MLFFIVSVLLSLLAGAALWRYLESTNWDNGESWVVGFYVVAMLFAVIGGTEVGGLVMFFGLFTMLWTLIFDGVASRRENNKFREGTCGRG